MDDVRYYNRALSVSEVKTLYQTGTAALNVSQNVKFTTGLIGLWSFDGKDVSGVTAYDRVNNNNATINAGKSIITTPGKIGQALNFPGDRNLSVTNSSTLNLGSGNFTVSAWVNDAAVQPAFLPAIISKNSGDITSGTAGVGWGIIWEGVYTFLANDGAHNPNGCTFASFSHNKWHHVTLTFGTSFITTYVDGVRSNQCARTLTGSIDTTNNLGIGSYVNFGRKLIASIDDVRLYNRELSASEVATLYKTGTETINASQNTRSTTGLVGLWSFDGNDLSGTTAYDRSGKGNNGAMAGGILPQVAGKIGQALNFPGDRYVQVNHRSALNFGAGNFTLSAWINDNAIQPDFLPAIITKTSGDITSGTTGVGWGIINEGTGRYVFLANDGAHEPNFCNFSIISPNQWHHLTATFGTSFIYLYIDGVQSNQCARTLTGSTDSTNALGIGTYINYGRKLIGKLDDVRIYNRALSASEVKTLYNIGK